MSPELVLIDPKLAVEARERLTDSARSFRPPQVERDSLTVEARGAAAAPLPEDATTEARQRLMERGLDSEVLGSLVPSGQHFRRRATLIPATAAATAVGLLLLQLYLNQGSLG